MTLTNKMSADSGITVLYNIDDQVGVTDYCDVYNLKQSSFRCYNFAIKKPYEKRIPGYYSGNSLPNYSLSAVKWNTEMDIISLDLDIYDTTETSIIPNHEWKIALRVGYDPEMKGDYHFMRKDFNSTPWRFKMGKGPVCQLLFSKTPDQVTWDLYHWSPLSLKYIVDDVDFYDSETEYMFIIDSVPYA